MNIVDFSPTIEELLIQVEQLQAENHRLNCAEDEKRIALEVVQQQQQQVNTMAAELEYAKLEANRARASEHEARQEAHRLQERINSILAICALSHERLSPYSKLALITGPDQVPYSAARHGGNPETMLTSMKQWNLAIGGNQENTNCLNKALKPLEDTGTVKKERIDLDDGRKHFTVEINQQHLNHPRFINPDGARPHNGGDKRCPQCHQYCKKRLALSYECVNCGIDFDKDMKPIDHPTVVPGAAETQKPDNIIDFPLPDLLSDEQMNAFGTKKARG